MKKVLTEIQDGTFASEFLTEMSPNGGRKVHFLAQRRMEAEHPIEKVGAELRSMLVSRKMSVGAMHKQAVRMVSAAAQARMLEAIEPELTEQEADITRRGRNAQAKHAAPKHADPADYAHATGLEALWGYLYVTKQTDRLDTLIRLAIMRTEDIWHKQS